MKIFGTSRLLRSAVVVLTGGIFFLLAMGVALLGSQVYRGAVADGDENSAHRTALSYVLNQIRRGDNGLVAVGDFAGCPAVRMTEYTPKGDAYVTLIYCYDGQLRELYMEADTGLAPGDGVAILPLETLEFTVDGRRLVIAATHADGHRWQAVLTPRAGLWEVGKL